MSKHRSCAEFGADRDHELLATFDRLMAESDGKMPLGALIAQVGSQPASRFYISELRAQRVLQQRRRGKAAGTSTPTRQRLYRALEERVAELMREDTALKFADAVVQAVNSPAPEFYMEPSSVRVTLYALLRRRRAERRARLLSSRAGYRSYRDPARDKAHRYARIGICDNNGTNND